MLPEVRPNPQRLWLTAGVLTLVVAFAVLYRDVVYWLVDDWEMNGDFSHGYLIVPLALWFTWERRAALRAEPVRPATSGLLIIAGSLVLLAAGTLGAETFLARISIVGTVAGAIVFLLGWRHLRLLAFPVGLLLLMIPIPSIIFNRVTLQLQFFASSLGERMLLLAQVPVLREGNVIELPEMSLQVAEACSGIRSLMSLITLAVLYGYYSERTTWGRVILVLGAAPIAIVANGFRIAGTGIAARSYGVAAAEGFSHTFSGWLVFVCSLGLLVLVHASLRRVHSMWSWAAARV
jgi:exosortase